MSRLFFFLACSVAMLLFIRDVSAVDLFTADVTIGRGTDLESREARGFSNAKDVLRFLETEDLSGIFPTYNDAISVAGDINFRGLDMFAGFEKDSTTLEFRVDSLNIEEKFTGNSRDDSIDKFVDFLTKDGGSLLNRVQKELARVSPVDPIAGNPNSLQARAIEGAFNDGAFDLGPTPDQPDEATDGRNLIGFSVNGGSFKSGGFRGTNITAPLSYTFDLDKFPGTKLKLKLPLTYTEIEGADVYAANPGLGLTVPIRGRGEDWSVTASFGYAITGSRDAGSVGSIIGGAITHKYNIARHLDLGSLGLGKRIKIIIGNMVGRYETIKLSIEGYSFNPDIKNTAFKNGVMVFLPNDLNFLKGWISGVKAQYAHTYLDGTDLYLNQYHDLAGHFVLPLFGYPLNIGITYTFGNNYDSVGGYLGYEF